MKYRLLIGSVILLALGYGAFWHSAANRAETLVKEGLDALNAGPTKARAQRIDSQGFPYRLQIRIDQPFLSNQKTELQWSAGAQRLMLFTHPWTPDHVVAEGTAVALGLGALTLSAPAPKASVVRGGGFARIDVDFGPVHLNVPNSKNQQMTADRMQLHLRLPDHKADSEASNAATEAPSSDALLQEERADIAISLTNLALGPFADQAPDPVISRLELHGELHGRLPTPVTARSLAQWRDQGGTIEISDLALIWGTVRITGDGSLTLDEQLRPLGALSLTIEQPGLLIAYLAAHGWIDRESAPYLREGMEQIATMGDGRAMRLPITMQDGRIFAGPFPVADTGPIVGGR
ncbi:hypothetical protein JCM17845_02130 [Iodidimonas gelatinilytica]|uniref:DUF2125 domain-containing protein n=1 Tax=Iodidimonas gelatinilytica TaxID=1236966 RepID=A0A5A7MXD4_9PROT|nr:DUF2125 domain-containing protein [Iodidimonas gelatinilytica]GEQ99589.1 hypothetical protein JCM17845_02130 [Iodidimonas gelatinilytica]